MGRVPPAGCGVCVHVLPSQRRHICCQKILGGTPVFVGTRVPAQVLFDCLEAGDSLERFLDQYPTVSLEQALGALEIARDALVKSSGLVPN
ncbi:MAG: DUF433 domain-containing protein [Chloroflexi bacterium]|nr:DUF433 domain-containing protein [Chloroflexota bacterium]